MTIHEHEPCKHWCPGDRERVLQVAQGGLFIWDFDGVIVDSEPLQRETYRIMLEMRDISVEADFFDTLIGLREVQIWEKIRSWADNLETSTPDLIQERRELFLRMAMSRLKPSWLSKDLIPVLNDYASEQFIISNGDPSTIASLLSSWGLSEYIYLRQFTEQYPTKSDLLRAVLSQSNRIVIAEDNREYLMQGKDGGSFCVAVHHGRNESTPLFGDVHVRIGG